MTFHELLLTAARHLHPLHEPQDLWRRARFVLLAIRHHQLIVTLLSGGAIAAALAERPQLLGAVEWPFLHKDWDVARRFGAMRAHHAEVASMPWLRLGVEEVRPVSDLGDVYPGLRVLIDRPEWFLREGKLSLNLFLGDERIYTLAFALDRFEGKRVARIGAMQGRDLENIEGIYRDLTKKLHGARPRDFLFTVFQMICQEAGVERIFGVSEACRHHLHPYFGSKSRTTPSANYDQIWRDRGGVPCEGGFFEMPVSPGVRPDCEIPSHKRSMYRKRYQLYDRVRADVRGLARGVKAELAAESTMTCGAPLVARG